jgi:hypothetical protein
LDDAEEGVKIFKGMATQNLHKVKKAIYNKLKNDSTLTGLLGGPNIFYERNPQTPIYPAIIYNIVTETEYPYNSDDDDGKITETTFAVTIFSDSSKSEESDNIESRVKYLLHGGGKLSDSDVLCYTCFKQYVDQRKDAEVNLWITTSVYRLVSAAK